MKTTRDRAHGTTFFQRTVLRLALTATVVQPVSVSAQIAAAAGSYRPQVDSAANGVPLIQITAPTAAGISRNQYEQFNVGRQGVVLNNSPVIAPTQLAGFVAGNPSLASGGARIILNEVTSSLPSGLRGYAEVAGARAEVIIANPNGITCDGCGFINASRGVLTTGTPVFGAAGNLDAFRVVAGQISVSGAGLNAANTAQVDLIARAVQANAEVWGQALNVIAGNALVSYADLSVQTLPGNGGTPVIGIDVAELGGMYANKIRLVGSEAGVGVASAGTLAAQSGDLTIDSAGQLTLGGHARSSGRIDLSARQEISNSGQVIGQQDVSLSSGGAVRNSGSLVAQRSLDVVAATLDSSGTLAAGGLADSQGALAADGALRVGANGAVRAVGRNSAGSDIVIRAGSVSLADARTSAGGALIVDALNGDIDLSNGALQSAGDVMLEAAASIVNDRGRVLAGRSLSSRSSRLSNRDGQFLQDSGASATIVARDVFDNRGGVLAGNGATTLVVGELDNRGGAVQAQGQSDLTVSSAGRIDNGTGGVLAAGGMLTVGAGELGNAGGRMTAGVDAGVTAVAAFDNRQGYLAAARGIDVAAQAIDNRSGVLGAVAGATRLATTGGVLDNTGGRIEAAQALELSAGGVANTDGVAIGQDVRVDSRGQAFVNTRGQLIAGGTLAIDSGAANNDAGLIQASGALSLDTHGATLSNAQSAGKGILGERKVTLKVGALINQGGAIASLGADDLALTASGRVDNRGGVLAGNGATTLVVGELDNRGGAVQAQGQSDLTVSSAGRIDNGTGGVLAAGGMLTVGAGELGNAGGRMTAGVDAGVTAVAAFDNRQGYLAAARGIDVAAQAIDNRSGVLGAVAGATRLATTGGVLDNTGGRIEAAQALELSAGGVANTDGVAIGQDVRVDSRGQAFVNTRGQLIAGGTLAIDSGAANNDAGLIQASGALSLDTHGATLSNAQSAGKGILGERKVTLKVGALINQGGAIASLGADDLALTASGRVDNRGGVLAGNGATTLVVGELDNRGGAVQAQGQSDLTVSSAGRIDNGTGGVLAAGGMLTVGAGELANVGGRMMAGVDAGVTAVAAFDNRQGYLAAARGIDVAAQAIDNRSGVLGAVAGATRLATTGGVLDNTGGRIEAAQALELSAGGVANTDGVAIGQDVRVDSRGQAFVNTRGQLIAGGTLAIDSGAANNDGGLIQASGALSLDTHGATLSNAQSAGKGILGERKVTLKVGALINQGGAIASLGADDLVLVANGRVDNGSGGLLVAGRSLEVTANDVANVGGQMSAGAELHVNIPQSLDNRQGTIAAAGGVGIVAQGINNAGGTIAALNASSTLIAGSALENSGGRLWAGQDLGVSASSVGNAGGRLSAARDLGISTGALGGDGVVLAGRDLRLAFGGSYTHGAANTLKANRNFDLTLGGTLINQGTLSAVGRLGVGAASIDNRAGASVQAGSASLVAAQSFANAGTIWANDLTLGADTLDNSGSVFGRDIAVNARVLNNWGSGVIAAGNALDLYVGSVLTNVDGGLLYSSGRLAIAADAQRDGNGWLAHPTGYMLNRSASIEARGDLELSASQVDNLRTSAVTATRSLSSSTTLEQLCDENWSGCRDTPHINGSLVTVDTTVNTVNDIAGTSSTTTSSREYLAGGSVMSGSQDRYFLDPSSLGTFVDRTEFCFSPGVCYRQTTTETVRVTSPYGEETWGPAAGRFDSFMLRAGVHDGVPNERRRVVVADHLQDYVVSATPEGRLLAGGNLYLRAGTVNNQASRIEATGSLSASVGTLNNTGTTLYDRLRETIWHGSCADIHGDRPGMLGNCGSGWLWTTSVSDSIVGSGTSLDAVFRGGQTLALSAITINNRNVDAQGLTPGGVNLSSAGRVYGAAPTSVVFAATPYAVTPTQASRDASTGATPYAVTPTQAARDSQRQAAVKAIAPRAMKPFVFAVASGGLYTVRTAPAAPYLVETDPRFTQYASFVSSNYLLGRVGLDPAAVQKRLGDGYYEQQLVRDQIINLRGQASLGGYATLDDEYRALLEAGAQYARAFSIVPGVTLTQPQIAGLAHDMVWLETRVVDGQDVLVPVVYLAQGSEANSAPGGAVIAGGRTTQIDAVDVDNSGAIVSDGTARVVARHDIVNDSGFIAGQDVVLAAGNDLHLGTATRSVSVAPGQTFTHEGLAGTVTGRSVELSAGRDLTLAGGLIDAGRATLVAGRDLSIGTQSVTSEQRAAAGGSQYERTASEERASGIVTRGDLTLVANNDLTVAGSRLESGGDLRAAAGNDLILSAARNDERVDYEAHHGAIGASLHSATSRAQGDALIAGGSLELTAGGTLASEGATLRAAGDVALGARRIVLDAAYDQEQRSESYSNLGKRGQQQRQSELASQSARGTIVAAGGDLTVRSAGDTEVVGGALAAGGALSLATGGDLALLAARSSSSQHIVATSQDARKATSLNYSDEETRRLLTTLAAGTSLTVSVGGGFSAEVGERNADGTLRADRMTADGIVKGDSRQQVSVTRTGVGANATPTSSQVRGDLASQGIRNGADDAFTPGATAGGGAALEGYLASGLVQVRNEPVVAGELKRILQGDGATLSTRDASGAVSLTVAGQAKVQAVYNTLKLSETFDEKRFANAGVAQAVTLVAAVALTVMTAGAGAASIGAVMAGGVGTGSMMINAAVVAMASTMTGQLAGGASFEEALSAGLKAGATSAMTAGILNAPLIDGGAQGMQSINQLANVQTTGANIVGKFSADTLGQNLAGMAVRGVVNAGVNSAIYGGSFGESFKSSFVSDLAAVGANAVGLSTETQSPGNVLGHAAVGGVAARLKGQDGVAGAIGGAAGALVNPLLDQAIGGPDGSGWGSDPLTAQQWQSGTLQLASMGVSAGIASALGKDGMTAATAAQNETVNNFLTKEGILQKQARLAQARDAEERAAIIKEYIRTSTENTNAAFSGLKSTVMTEADLVQKRADLQTLLAGPISPSVRAEIQQSISEINGILAGAHTAENMEPVWLAADALLTLATAGEYAIGKFGVKSLGRLVEGVGANTIARIDQATVDGILSLPKGGRPNPATYLSQDFIDSHLAQFDGGVTKLSSGVPSGVVGPPGGTFVMPKSIADNLIKQSGGNVVELERLLSLEPGTLGTSPVRIDISSPKGLRMPSGNELGANKQWLPGGFTGGGIPEATINPAKPGTYIVNPVFPK